MCLHPWMQDTHSILLSTSQQDCQHGCLFSQCQHLDLDPDVYLAGQWSEKRLTTDCSAGGLSHVWCTLMYTDSSQHVNCEVRHGGTHEPDRLPTLPRTLPCWCSCLFVCFLLSRMPKSKYGIATVRKWRYSEPWPLRSPCCPSTMAPIPAVHYDLQKRTTTKHLMLWTSYVI